jgi:GT2 family glycosyltransferase
MLLVEGTTKFVLRGVCYGPFRPNQRGEHFPDDEKLRRDLDLIRALGANAIRVYHVPPPDLCLAAEEFGLRLVVGIPWAQHIRFLDSQETRMEIRRWVRAGAHQLRGTPNTLALLVGNEISPQILRWYGPARVERFLRQLADEAKQADPEALVSYASFPSTEYLDLSFADLVCFNVYLHQEPDLRRYLARLQNLSGSRPLVLSEFGIDSESQGEEKQARIVGRTAELALDAGCAGTIVSSFTDEWFTGGYEIESWRFGLVRRDRKPKPAYQRIREVYSSEFPRPRHPAPRVSVVVCAYNAERTMEECLASLRLLDYPDYEVIVVDDGSTDRTPEIAQGFPEFRLLSQENAGLSAARNAGILAATGEVVAFTDSDCAVDPDWLTFLVDRLCDERFAGVGGPNLPPPGDDWIAEVVARAPGGPTHVLLTDFEAEHVPGCNMAFWRKHLNDVGLFDPVFRTAGDDVDICWRLQNEGYRIGYAPSALVWHRRRNTLRAYLKQQTGYGRAESHLRFKHPRRFNEFGRSRWAGRIYGGVLGSLVGRGAAVYSGRFGSALFQTLYEPAGSLWSHLPTTFEWNAVAAALVAAGLATKTFGLPLPNLLLVGLVLFAISLAHVALAALRVDVGDLPSWKARPLIALLCYLGPVARAFARYRHRIPGYSPTLRVCSPEPRQRGKIDWLRRSIYLSYWNETGVEKEECLDVLLDFLRERDCDVKIDDGWQSWDLRIRRGLTVGRIKVLVQSYDRKKRQVDVGMALNKRPGGKLLRGVYAATIAVGFATGGTPFVLAGLIEGLLIEGFLLWESLGLALTFQDAMDACAQLLPILPLRAASRSPRPRLPGR